MPCYDEAPATHAMAAAEVPCHPAVIHSLLQGVTWCYKIMQHTLNKPESAKSCHTRGLLQWFWYHKCHEGHHSATITSAESAAGARWHGQGLPHSYK